MPGYTLLGLSEHDKLFAWEIIEHLDQVAFNRLGQARPDVVFHCRSQHMDGDLVKVIDPEDIYPFCLVDNPLSAIKGSCWTYTTRKEVEKVLTWP